MTGSGRPSSGIDASLRAVALGMGSNLGSRIDHLRAAARHLAKKVLVEPRFSRVYETAPAYGLDQPAYLNACCVGWTRLEPGALLVSLKGLESNAGRDPDAPRFSSRPLDLDILLYANEVVETPHLAIPHAALADRAFVLLPLAEVAGAWRHPALGRSISELAAAIDPEGVAVTDLRLTGASDGGFMSRRTLDVRVTGGGSYPIHIEPGLLDEAASICRRHAPAHRYAVIADSQVARLFGAGIVSRLEDAGLAADLFPFPAGEWNKSREQWAALSDRMLHARFGRDSAVVALGGGVAGDLAGFVAATYMRGVPVIQIPTTLLAMLDSSVGGKTGVDTEAGKNLIGAFHHPSAVLIDPTVLETLPRHQRSAGLAEAVKTAAILDVELWDWMTRGSATLSSGDPDASAELIERVVRHKAAVVGDDPLERGRREILNFGHTVGHALEALEGYKLLHGEAVAAGMRVESRLGELLGITEHGTSERLAALLEACGLGGDWETDREPTEIRDAMSKDKKARQDRIRCVFLSQLGEVATDTDGRHSFGLGEEDLGEPLATALRPAPGG